MFLLRQILPAAIVALAIAAALSAGAIFCRNERLRQILAPFALGFGYFFGHFFMTGWTAFPPTDTTNWLPYFALAAAAAGSLLHSLNSKTARIALITLTAMGALRLLLDPKFRYGWSLGRGWMWVFCLTLVVSLIALSLSAIDRRSAVAFELPVLLLIVYSGTSGALMLSGSLLLGQFAAVLAAVILGTLVLALRGVARAEGIAPGFSLLLIALLVSGYFFADLPGTSAILLAAAPAFVLLSGGIIGAQLMFALRVILLCAPIGIALLLAFLSSPPLD